MASDVSPSLFGSLPSITSNIPSLSSSKSQILFKPSPSGSFGVGVPIITSSIHSSTVPSKFLHRSPVVTIGAVQLP